MKNKKRREKSQKCNIKQSKAITLISLIITIILLILLAGIAINLSMGENGLFNKAKQASPSARGTERLIFVASNKSIDGGTCNDPETLVYGIRPVVCLNNETIGTIKGDLVIIE